MKPPGPHENERNRLRKPALTGQAASVLPDWSDRSLDLDTVGSSAQHRRVDDKPHAEGNSHSRSEKPRCQNDAGLRLALSARCWRQRRGSTLLIVFALVAAAIVAVPSIRNPVLRAAGWALVVDEPVAPSDIIVVSLDSGGAGALEAADLVQRGIATRVAIFVDPPVGEDLEFIRRGLPYEDASARQIRQLRWLGVTDVVRIPRTDAGTEGEGQVLPPWCDQHEFRSVVFVVARHHSRRIRRLLNRVMKGHSTRVTVQAEPYSGFDPDRWWETRGGIRTEIQEFQKLVLSLILHPTSF
jgi:hypothetical protein